MCIAIQKTILVGKNTTLDGLYEAVESSAGIESGSLLMRNFKGGDSFSMVYVKGKPMLKSTLVSKSLKYKLNSC